MAITRTVSVRKENNDYIEFLKLGNFSDFVNKLIEKERKTNSDFEKKEFVVEFSKLQRRGKEFGFNIQMDEKSCKK